MTKIIISSAGLTDIGRKRQSNQDIFLVDDTYGLYLVADGMGGHQAGEVASQLVVESIRKYYSAGGSRHEPNGKPLHDPFLSPEANRLREAIRYANRQVFQAAEANEAYRGMGSTVAAVKFAQDTFVAANVGDSPIYLIHEASIETLSVPHTVIAQQNDFNAEDQALFGPYFQNLLTRGMGVEETVQPDICESPCFGGDRLVICSDGLSGTIAPGEILDVVSSQNAAEACELLVEMANQRGGDDNITVVVLQISKENSLMERWRRWMARFTPKGPVES
jgi:protein phosphatase